MTIRQRQHLLAYLGFYEGSIDGIWGQGSRKAAEAFQCAFGGIDTDGIVGEETEQALRHAVFSGMPQCEALDFWKDIQYFTREELRCKCGGRYCDGFPAEPKEQLVRLAEAARKHFDAPAHNISCLRCPTWNTQQGGVANSQHMYGEAMDICIDGVTAEKLLVYFRQQPEVRYAYKINETNVHFDIAKGVR